MNCENCGTEVHGELKVLEQEEEPFIAIVGTPDRDWILCEGCNALLCHACCTYPQSGYCDPCIQKYNLYDYLWRKG